jgi:orotate phosphoribosyltransferase
MIRTSYFDSALNPDSRKSVIDMLVTILSNVQFDAIACRGVSGLTIAPIVAHLLDKPLIIVRKPNESAHSTNKYEGCYNFKNYIIIDDFVSTGGTVGKIQELIKGFNPNARYIGVFTYQSMASHCNTHFFKLFSCTTSAWCYSWGNTDVNADTIRAIYSMCKEHKLSHIPVDKWLEHLDI